MVVIYGLPATAVLHGQKIPPLGLRKIGQVLPPQQMVQRWLRFRGQATYGPPTTVVRPGRKIPPLGLRKIGAGLQCHRMGRSWRRLLIVATYGQK